MLSAEDRNRIEDAMQALRHAVQHEQDAKTLEDVTKALAQATEAFAAERMNHSIQKALSGQNIQSL